MGTDNISTTGVYEATVVEANPHHYTDYHWNDLLSTSVLARVSVFTWLWLTMTGVVPVTTQSCVGFVILLILWVAGGVEPKRR